MRNHFPFGLRNFFHIVIESGNGNPSVSIRHLADNLAKCVDGISHRTAEMSGV